MKAKENSSQTSLIRIANYRVRTTFAAACVAALIGLTSALNLQATVLDSFTGGVPSGWTDTLNGGTVVESGAVFNITTATTSGSLTYSRKTGSSFSVAPGSSLEFKVDVMTVTGGATSPLKILGWVPTGGALLANGYSVAVSQTDVTVYKNATVLTNITGLSLQNSALTIALRMTGSGSAVTINARVYKQIPNGLIGQYFTCLSECTVVDSSGLLVAGNPALGVKSQSSGAAAVAYDTLQVFTTATSVYDSFSGGTLDTTKWKVFKKDAAGPGSDSVTVGPNGLDALATIADATGGFSGVYSDGAGHTYSITDGGQVEFQLNIVDDFGNGGSASYAALGFLPLAADTLIFSLFEYHLAADIANTTIIVNGKTYNSWWGGLNTIQPPLTPPGSLYIMTMTGEGANCRIESRIEDVTKEVNDPLRVVYQNEFVDTPNKDAGLNENNTTKFPYTAPYGYTAGRFVVSTFNAGATPPGGWAEVIYSNAVVRLTAAPPAPPILANLVPGYGSNFMATSSHVAFDVSDINNLPINGMSVTLNGVTYANGSGGVTITPGGSATAQHFDLAGVLTANLDYHGTIQATNSIGLVSTLEVNFDTFLTSDYTVEAEEYNFSSDFGATGGSFIDNPSVQPEGFNALDAYNTRMGLPEVDFHDTRGTAYGTPGAADVDHAFRYDYPYNSHNADNLRAKYASLGGNGAGYYEIQVEDIEDNEWRNYTHTYPSGTYNVYLRQATYLVPNSLVTLERVTSDRTIPGQSTAILGTFAASVTGLGLFDNVPLTDGPGANMVLRLSGGVDTLRLDTRVSGGADLDTGAVQQNYMVLVPVSDPGTLRPVIALVTPLANSVLLSATAAVTAEIANRDTSVAIGTIGMKINGAIATVTATPTNNGAFVSATIPLPLPPSGSIVTNELYYQDSGGIWQTGVWKFTAAYSYLAASSSLPPGSLTMKGVDARLVQSAAADTALGNGVATARTMLEQPMPYTVDLTSTNIASVVAWDQTLPGSVGATANFPGLCLGDKDGIAYEVFAYLDLTAGAHTFNIEHDDAVGVYSGPSLRSDTITLAEAGGSGGGGVNFSFVAAAAGLYPIHIVYQEGGGSAYLVLTCTDTGSRVVVNTPGAPAAYYPFVVKSSSSPKGTYTVDAAANASLATGMTTANVLCDGTGAPLNQTMTGGTITIPLPSSPKFYLIDGPRPTKITSVKKVGANLEIKFTGQ